MSKFRPLYQSVWAGRALDFGLGALCVLGLAPFHLWILALFGFGVLKLRLDAALNGRMAFGRGFLFGFGFFLVGMYWVGSAFLARGGGYIFIMPPMILGLAALLAFFWGLGGWLYKFVCGTRDMNRDSFNIGLSVFAFTAAFTLIELIRGHIFTGLPWNLPGYIFPAGGEISQIAFKINIYGLTALTLMSAALLSCGLQALTVFFRATQSETFSIKKLLCPLLILLILLGSLLGFGNKRLSEAHIEYVENVKLRIIQVRFDQSNHFDRDRSIAIVNDYIRLTAETGLDDITHVIWPEGAVSGLAIENASLFQAMSTTLLDVDDTPPHWLLNSLRQEQRPLKNGRSVFDYYNSSVSVSFDNHGYPAVSGLNDKTKLVPFGEFVPLGKWVEQFGIKSLSTAMASISPAKEKRNARFPDLPLLSPQICYEIIFPGLTPRSGPSNISPQWILNQSNDAWYGNSIGPHQHFNQARYRAIEEGVPIIRASANGVSGSIDAYGRPLKVVDPKYTMALDLRLPKGLLGAVSVSRSILSLLLITLCILLICAKNWRGGR